MLWEITKVGFWTSSITFAIVYVFPDPVTPSKVWWDAFSFNPSDNSDIAVGWSPAGENFDSTLKSAIMTSNLNIINDKVK